jgi:SSS family solute:Na+ symporter
LAIVASYLGWVSAQNTALGLVFSLITHGSISAQDGIIIGAGIGLVYTLFGGMWSVALTDFFQMIIIVVGMLYIGWVVTGYTGGVGNVVSHAQVAGKFQFWPRLETRDLLAFIAAWVTMMFGSIPQQDVFQRVMSAKSENIAVTGAVLGGSLYFLFAFIPIFLAYSAMLIDPASVSALLSAIMNTASGTLLAPSVTFTENILKPFIGHLSDRHLLWAMRAVVVGFACIVTLFALYSNASIYHMVENAYKVTLVAAFVPLVFGLYWKHANTQGALFAIALGVSLWLLEIFHPDGL